MEELMQGVHIELSAEAREAMAVTPIAFAAAEATMPTGVRKSRAGTADELAYAGETGGIAVALQAARDEAEITAIQPFDIEPVPFPTGSEETAGRTTRRLRGAEAADGTAIPPTLPVTIDLAEDEGAAILVEQDGVYRWEFPTNAAALTPSLEKATRRTRSRAEEAAPTRQAIFSLPVPIAEPFLQPVSPPTKRLRGEADADEAAGPREWLLGKARHYIIKFVVGKTIDFAIGRMERNATPGIVVLPGSPQSNLNWQRFDSLSEVVRARGIPDGGLKRILLLVHGTFSSTVGSFSDLEAHGSAFLEQAWREYDLVIGYDHRTLSMDPEQNALDLRDRLESALRPYSDSPPEVDAIAYSRGGLVLRSFTEFILPNDRMRLNFNRLIFVGCTNGGTNLANSSNWKSLVDLYTNLTVAAGTVIGTVPGAGVYATFAVSLMKGLGAFVKFLATQAVDEKAVPGLWAMDPKGPFIKRVNTLQEGQTALDYYAVTSNFQANRASSSSLIGRALITLADRFFIDKLIGAKNDLVVNTDAMLTWEADYKIVPENHYSYGENGDNGTVYHLCYFSQAKTIQMLTQWLLSTKGSAPKQTIRSAPLEMVRSAPVPASEPTPVDTARTIAPVDSPPRRLREFNAAIDDEADTPFEAIIDRGAVRSATEPSAVDEASGDTPFHIRGEMDGVAHIGRLAALDVYLSREQIAAIREISVTSTFIPQDASQPIYVSVTPRLNYAIEGGDLVKTELPRTGETLKFRFLLTPRAVGDGEVLVEVIQLGHILARLVLRNRIQPMIVAGDNQLATEPRIGAVASLLRPSGDSDEAVQHLLIAETHTEAGITLQYTLISQPLNIVQKFVGPTIVGKREEFTVQLYARLEKLLPGTNDASDLKLFRRKLLAEGGALAEELLPEPLRNLLWEGYQEGKLRGILIISGEPMIPWELVLLRPVKQEEYAEKRDKVGFLADVGAVRWLEGRMPSDRLPKPPSHNGSGGPSGRIRFVIPEYKKPGNQLADAASEAELLEKMGGERLRADESAILDLLETPDALDILHFAGHGEADSGSIEGAALLLGDEPRRELTAKLVKDTALLRKNASEPGPLVFINACRTGKTGYRLTSIGGFAQAFLAARAGAFIGGAWSVYDDSAKVFMETFYDRFVEQGATLSEAARAARESAKALNDTTYLAFVVYGHPHARLAEEGQGA